ncbi:SDR family NAD(P)-dependent oxidoreductase [Novosphingobium sp. MW5]|nr:SDR family NAD(P)-dependent oxidoreductase [Novosphingobium sp. MW5]
MSVQDLAAAMGKPLLVLPAWVLKVALGVAKPLGLSRYGPEQVRFLQYRPVLDNSALKERFGYTPGTDLGAGLRALASMGAAMRTAVITGGGGGLGRALAAGLQARGWFCALLDLPGGFGALKEGAQQSLHARDVTDPEQVAATVAGLRAVRPSLDLAVYNAGVTLIAPFAAMDPAAHRRAFEINYWGAVNLAAALLPDLRAARGTHLAITSVAGFAPLKHRTAYAASKHAMTGFFTSLRGEEGAARRPRRACRTVLRGHQSRCRIRRQAASGDRGRRRTGSTR